MILTTFRNPAKGVAEAHEVSVEGYGVSGM